MVVQFKAVGLVTGVIASCLVSVISGQDDPPPSGGTIGTAKSVPVYTVSEYDSDRNPADDLAATIKRARAENRRIILEIGGHW